MLVLFLSNVHSRFEYQVFQIITWILFLTKDEQFILRPDSYYGGHAEHYGMYDTTQDDSDTQGYSFTVEFIYSLA